MAKSWREWLCERGYTAACRSIDPVVPPPPVPDDEQEDAYRFESVWLSRRDIKRLTTGLPHYDQVRGVAAGTITGGPPTTWYVANYYRERSKHLEQKRLIQTHFNAAYALALRAIIEDDSTAGNRSAEIIGQWSGTVFSISRYSDSALVWCYNFPTIVAAADLLRQYSKWEDWGFESLCQHSIDAANTILERDGVNSKNNWAGWALACKTSCAAFIGDGTAMDSCRSKYEELLDEQINSSGELRYEIRREGSKIDGNGRKGITYSFFALTALTITAQVFETQGDPSLFEFTPGQNRTLRRAWNVISEYALKGRTPYNSRPQLDSGVWQRYGFSEVLAARWKSSTAEKLLALRRPIKPGCAIPFTSFTHRIR